MNRSLLSLKNVSVTAFGKLLLSKADLCIQPGEVHVIMGPNGAGKSTLLKALIGHPDYRIASGIVTFKGHDLEQLAPEERARQGLFLSFQNPVEIPGVSNRAFLKAAYDGIAKARGECTLPSEEFDALLTKIMDQVQLKSEMRNRDVNAGFSGGEKKKNEIVQMLLLQPDLAILDEIDSGLDVDGLKAVSSAINSFMTKSRGLLLVTHYQRLLDYVRPDFIHIMLGGKIVLSSGPEVVAKLERQGYEWVSNESNG